MFMVEEGARQGPVVRNQGQGKSSGSVISIKAEAKARANTNTAPVLGHGLDTEN
jgi:hypothetical protein